MTEQLSRRAALVLLGSMLLGVSVGLTAWGPVRPAGLPGYADTRTLVGIPNALNVLSGLAMLIVSLWGVRVTWGMDPGTPVRRSWLCVQACGAVSGALAAAYHVEPNHGLSLLSSALLCACSLLLCLSMLAERAHESLGSATGVLVALGVVGCMTLAVQLSTSGGEAPDLRPLLMLEILPLLLIPAGALSLDGRGTKASDWIAMLSLYALAKLFELADAVIFGWGGWISGHSLMHLALAAVAGWLAVCARRHVRWAAGVASANKANTSAYTSS